ncbi:MAG: acyl-CoA thioesterase [Bacteroidia bacterium]|nr:acyl-CoA thioesterase [Bacteroidia bacterium]
MENENYDQLKFRHNILVQIRFNDIDILGHVNNGVYQNYFDLAKVGYFNFTLNGIIDWKKSGLVLAKITIDYIKPVYLEETIAVQSKVIKFGNKSLEMMQQIINSSTGEIKATALSVMVGFNYFDNEAMQIPGNWKERITDFEKDNL